MPALTHIAAAPILIDGRLRQRCAWCGAVIDDVDLTRIAVAVEPGQDPGPYPSWPDGAQVRVDGGWRAIVHEEGEADGDVPALAPDSCARLPHELTGTPTEAVDHG